MKEEKNIWRAEWFTENTACRYRLPNTSTMEKLAKMPSREVLLARLVGSMSATIGNFVRVVEAVRKKMAGEE